MAEMRDDCWSKKERDDQKVLEIILGISLEGLPLPPAVLHILRKCDLVSESLPLTSNLSSTVWETK